MYLFVIVVKYAKGTGFITHLALAESEIALDITTELLSKFWVVAFDS